MKSLVKFSIVAAILVLMVTNASALSVVPLFNAGGPVLLSDNSAEYLIKAPGTEGTTLDIGDRLRGMFTIGTFEVGGTTTAVGGGTAYNEMTGYFDVVVSDKAAGGLGFNFSFAPYAGFATEVENSLGYAAGTLAGTMLAVYEDSSQNYSRLATGGLTTVEQLITTANDGSYMFSLGSTGQLGEGWSASSLSDDVGGFALPGAANFGLFNYGLNIIDNVTFINFTDVATAFGGFADLSGSGSLVSQFGFDTPFDVFDNVDMTVNTTVVPEPSTLILLGFGMVGVGVIVRNRRKDS